MFVLNKIGYIDLKWNDQNEIDTCLDRLFDLSEHIWREVLYKWNDLYKGDLKKLEIIQGAIGYTSIIRLLGNLIKEKKDLDNEKIKKYISHWITSINITSTDWEPGGKFSTYSSESGYSIVSKDLKSSMLQNKLFS